jgi:alpha-L-fucosidase
VREALVGVEPASHLTDNQDALLTRKGNTLYVHLFKDPESRAVILKPLDTPPVRATLLNTGAELEARVDVTPRLWQEPPYLRIRGLPVEQVTDTPLVLKLEFQRLPPAT